MAMSAVTKMAWSILLSTCALSVATAQDVISPSNELPSLLSESSMKLSLQPSDSPVVANEYTAAPLTTAAGLGQMSSEGEYQQTTVLNLL